MESLVYSRKEMVLQRSYIEEQQITKKTGSAADILSDLDHHQRYELFEREYTKYENGTPLIANSKPSDPGAANLRKSRSEGGKMNLLTSNKTSEGKKSKLPNGHVVSNASIDPKVMTENLKNQQSNGKVKEAVTKYTTKVGTLNDSKAKPASPDSRVRAKSVGSLNKSDKTKKPAELVKSRSGSFVNGDFKRNGIFDIAYIRSLSPPPYPRCYWDSDSIEALNAANEQSRNSSPVLPAGDRAKYLASSYTEDEITSQVRRLEELLDRSSPPLTSKPVSKSKKSKAKKSSSATKEAKEKFILADPDDYAPYKSRDSFKLAEAEEYGPLRSEAVVSRHNIQPRNSTMAGNPPPAYEETITKTTAWVTGNSSSVQQFEQESQDKPRGVAIYTKYFGYNKPALPHHPHHENHHSHHNHYHSPTPSDRSSSSSKSPGLLSRSHHHQDNQHDHFHHPHIWVPTPFALADEKKQKSSAKQHHPASLKAADHQQPAHVAPGQIDDIQVLATTMVDSASQAHPSRKLAQFREEKKNKNSDKTNAFFDTLVFLGDCFLCHGERP